MNLKRSILPQYSIQNLHFLYIKTQSSKLQSFKHEKRSHIYYRPTNPHPTFHLFITTNGRKLDFPPNYTLQRSYGDTLSNWWLESESPSQRMLVCELLQVPHSLPHEITLPQRHCDSSVVEKTYHSTV